MATKVNAPQDSPALDAFGSGIPADLVFDDEPLEPLLYGDPPAPPTPVDVLERWRLGLDRSAAGARALAAVLARNPDALGHCADLDLAVACLSGAIAAASPRAGAQLAANWYSLARILELQNQVAEAATCYRQALDLQKLHFGQDHQNTVATGLRLLHLLEASHCEADAQPLRAWLATRQPAAPTNQAELLNLRRAALDLFLAGRYQEAETAYQRLARERFEPASTDCHLARLFLMTDREAAAREAAEQAWADRKLAPAYVNTRIVFLRTVLAMLANADWKSSLRDVQQALTRPDAHEEWHIQRVLDHLKSRLLPEQFALLTAIAAAINHRANLTALAKHPLWQSRCGES